MILLHIDVDNLWMYEQEFGININKDKELIYSTSLPILLKMLKKTRSKATFMIIGKDLLLPACQVFCRNAIADGHEIANHTWSHPVLFSKLSYEQKKYEIKKTHKLIIEACGKPPVGFRGAGYCQDKEIITILKKLNYKYDSSVLPGFAKVLMSAYAYIRGKKNRYKTFGTMSNILTQEHPYTIKGVDPTQNLLELPISILPLLRLPIHTTFAYYFGAWYRQLILRHLKSKPKYTLYLFHAIDFVDLHKQYSNHPVIPLRYSFDERMSFIRSILDILVKINGGGLKTSRDNIKAIRR